MKSQLREDIYGSNDSTMDFGTGVRIAQNIRYQLQEDMSRISPAEHSLEEFLHYSLFE